MLIASYSQVIDGACEMLAEQGIEADIEVNQPSILIESELYDLMRTYIGVEEAAEVQRQLVCASLQEVRSENPYKRYMHELLRSR